MSTETLIDGAPTTDASQQPAPASTPATAAAAPAAPADQPPADAAGKPDAAPAIEYEPFSLPEGLAIDEEMLGEFKATAKELGLTQEGAQKLADLQAKSFTKQQEAMAATVSQWTEQSKSDKEFGGPALTENLGVAKKALETFATPELRELLNKSGLGNHPEVIRTFYRVGKQISQDGRVITGSGAGAPADPAKRLFPNQA
jgi:hypothetical protein